MTATEFTLFFLMRKFLLIMRLPERMKSDDKGCSFPLALSYSTGGLA